MGSYEILGLGTLPCCICGYGDCKCNEDDESKEDYSTKIKRVNVEKER